MFFTKLATLIAFSRLVFLSIAMCLIDEDIRVGVIQYEGQK